MKNKKNKSPSTDMPLTQIAGSKFPLVSLATSKDTVITGYDPFVHRAVKHPTTNMETFMHLLKGCLGTGILAMPAAFFYAGLMFGLVATTIIGIICTYCVHVLVKCSHKLCRKRQVPSMGFSEIAEVSFLVGPEPLRKYSKQFKTIVDSFLIVEMLGCCCVYVVFVAKNLKQILGTIDFIVLPDNEQNALRLCILIILPLIVAISLIRNLKYLAPFSTVANVLISVSITVTFWFVFQDLPSVDTMPFVADWRKWPLFFGTAIFALEGIGVVMPLENNMKTPQHFIGCPSVLNVGMAIVVVSYFSVGFFGYLKYGDNIKAVITLNLPENDLLAQSTQVMIAVAIFLTYALQFFVPFEIIWNSVKHRFTSRPLLMEYMFRVSLALLTVSIAVAVPKLGPIISLVGALCLSFLGLILPSFIELMTVWHEPGLGVGYWRLWKNVSIMTFGALGLVTGVYCSIRDIIDEFGQ